MGKINIYKNLYINYDKKIGGELSDVYLGEYEGDENKNTVAIKRINIQNNDCIRELEIVNKLKNNLNFNIIKIFDMIIDDCNIFLVMEYCNDGDLKSIMLNPIKEEYCKYYFYQIVNGLNHLEELNIIHRDLKPENILLSNNKKTIKLIDFGLAKSKSIKRSDTICGSPLYMAPELLNNNKIKEKSDIWSIGIILYEMIYGKNPFQSCRDFQELIVAVNSEEKLFNNNKNIISKECEDLLRKLLTEEKDRLNIIDIINHPWLKNIKNYEKISLKDIFYFEDLLSSDESLNSNNSDDFNIFSFETNFNSSDKKNFK